MRAFYCLIILSVSIFADDKLKNFCKGKVESADSHRAVEGKDEWLFPFKEIQHLAKKINILRMLLVPLLIITKH